MRWPIRLRFWRPFSDEGKGHGTFVGSGNPRIENEQQDDVLGAALEDEVGVAETGRDSIGDIDRAPGEHQLDHKPPPRRAGIRGENALCAEESGLNGEEEPACAPDKTLLRVLRESHGVRPPAIFQAGSRAVHALGRADVA